MIHYSAQYEKEIINEAPGDEEKQAEAAKEMGRESAKDKIIKFGYQGLKLLRYFTADEKESKAQTMRAG